MTNNSPPKRSVRSYVLRQGRMTDAQKQSVEQLWPRYGVALADAASFDITAFFEQQAPLILEIGFGMGGSLAAMAAANPELNYLGVEVHRPGVGRLMRFLDEQQINNVRVVNDDAMKLLTEYLPDESLSGFQLFFPDPWPKKKHHKRRLVQPPFIELLVTKLVAGGFIHMATDWQPYAEHMEAVLARCSTISNAKGTPLYEQCVAQRPDTRFENRGKRLGHTITELVYKKNS